MSFKKTNLCFGNWKLNKNPNEANEFIDSFKEQKSLNENDLKHFCVFPSSLIASSFSNTDLNWGGQNCYFEDSGAFTGETSAKTLKEMGAEYCLVGHSERRQIFNESDEALNKKVVAVIKNSLTPVFCIGETEEEREAGKTFEVLKKQVENGLKGIDLSKVIVAYEPVWAIGTGKTATFEIASEVHDWLRSELLKEVPLLYGGSVKPSNAGELYQNSNINGFLIGGASLNSKDFFEIYQAMKSVES